VSGHGYGATMSSGPTTQAYVDLGDVRMYHEISGEGRPLLLLHGAMCTADTYAGLAAELAPSYAVHRPEQRGHGRTADVPGPLDYAVMAADTIAFIEALDLGPAHLAGWSDGAVVALQVAMARPDLVAALVFIGNPLTLDGLPAEMLPLPETYSADVMPQVVRDMYGAVSPDGPDHFDVVFDKLAPMWNDFPLVDMDALSELGVPTLVVVADRDMVTVEHADALRRTIPDARLAVLPGDHSLPMAKPGLTAAVVLDFLADVEARSPAT
jgi:pimeloyl-ACP methyl ester carboxylesterase